VLTDLLGALGLLLVIEGIVPFLSPRRFRQALLQFAAVEDRTMRVVGLACMVGGILLLNAVK
jgi:uncharacterized protein YjeT (DUF2065 family)